MTAPHIQSQSNICSLVETSWKCINFLLRLTKYLVQSTLSSACSSGASLSHISISLCHVSCNLFLFLQINSSLGGLGVSALNSKSSHLSISSITSLGFTPLKAAVTAGAGGEGGAVHVVTRGGQAFVNFYQPARHHPHVLTK